MNFLSFLVMVALCLTAVCQRVWDPDKKVEFAADDDLFSYYTLRGNDIVCAFKSTELGAGKQLLDSRQPPSSESVYTGMRYSAFTSKTKNWFWRRLDPHPLACDFKFQGWEQVLTDLGRLEPRDKWICRRWAHFDASSAQPIKDQEYWVTTAREMRIRYIATGAVYNHAYNYHVGIVLLQAGITPKIGAQRYWQRQSRIPDGDLPQIRQQSDFLWNDYDNTSSRKPVDFRKLAYCGMTELNDAMTLKLIARAILARGLSDLEDWPASNSEFWMNTAEARALLASPAGHQCALFMIQHKKIFGIRHVHSVKVFRGPARTINGKVFHFPQILFEIIENPQDQIKPDPGPDWRPGAKPVMPLLKNPPPIAPPAGPAPAMPSQNLPSQPQSSQHRAGPGHGKREVSYEVSSNTNGYKNFVRVHTFYAT